MFQPWRLLSLQSHTVNQAAAPVKKGFHLCRDAENVVGTGQDKAVAGEQLFLYHFVVILDGADSGFVADISADTRLNLQGVQAEDFCFSTELLHSGKHLFQKAAGVALHSTWTAIDCNFFIRFSCSVSELIDNLRKNPSFRAGRISRRLNYCSISHFSKTGSTTRHDLSRISTISIFLSLARLVCTPPWEPSRYATKNA